MKEKKIFYKTNEGYNVEVVEFKDEKMRLIKFPDGKTKLVEQSSLSKGRIKNPLHRSVFKVGYLGYGDYKTSVNSIKTDCYNIWVNMLLRCYSDNYQRRNPSYIGAIVCEQWQNYQNFSKWFYEESNYKTGYELDKDLLILGNKEYNSENCRFIPKELNSILHSGKGVYYDKTNNKFVSTCSLGNGRSKKLGRFLTQEAAFDKYKEVKENYIKQRAEFYKDDIPCEIYKALLNFKVNGERI